MALIWFAGASRSSDLFQHRHKQKGRLVPPFSVFTGSLTGC